MTYNIKGETGDLSSTRDSVIEVIKQISPDILVIQEAAEFQDADGVWHSALEQAERKQEGGPLPFPGQTEEAQTLRFQQAKRLLDLLRERVLEREQVVLLLGDFNAVSSEPCIASVLETEGGLVRLTPTQGPDATHPKVLGPIDRIFVYPRNRLRVPMLDSR
jgi:endonuclease/exonuclease/phosphatase family metal-dependent hydrolase